MSDRDARASTESCARAFAQVAAAGDGRVPYSHPGSLDAIRAPAEALFHRCELLRRGGRCSGLVLRKDFWS
jgi:hypothetical protein